MSKAVRLSFSLFAFVLMVASAGCAHKPAYNDIDVNKNSRNQNQNGEAQAGASSQAAAEAPQSSAPQPATAPDSAKVTMPSFLVNGSIKDLPSFPRSSRTNLQIGPVQGANVMTLSLHTSEPMEKVQVFYTQAIKENQWTVSDKLLDPEVSEWTLTKGETDSAKVQARKDPRTGGIDILIVRAEKIAAQSK